MKKISLRKAALNFLNSENYNSDITVLKKKYFFFFSTKKKLLK